MKTRHGASHKGGSFTQGTDVRPPRVLVGVSGGIAAYKVPAVVRGLREAGVDVVVAPTPESLHFVGKTTWEALSGQPVHVDTREGAENVVHVRTGQDADLVLIAPATANTMAKVAAGMADNLLTASILVATGPVLMAPAMHTEMWNNPATQANIAVLANRGVQFVGPESGRLTGADSGIGRMSEPEDIVAAALGRLAQMDFAGNAETCENFGRTGEGVAPGAQRDAASGAQCDAAPGAQRDLAGVSVTISAGGTREPIDPVRFIANRSSGRMGVQLAREAKRRGADVTLVTANIGQEVLADVPRGVAVRHVETALDLQEAMVECARTADVVVMSAAVSDFRVAQSSGTKIKRDGDLQLTLVENPDILAGLVKDRRPGQVVVGFAAETGDEETTYVEFGRLKARRKGADLLVINQVGAACGFGDVETEVTIVNSAGQTVAEAAGTKSDVARAIIQSIMTLRKA